MIAELQEGTSHVERDTLNAWIGREQVVTDCVTDRLSAQYRAGLDPFLFDEAGGNAPPGIHWCLGTPDTPTGALCNDGHPPRGDFLPPLSLPRRMWAGGRIICWHPIPLGSPICRRSKISSIDWKDGKSGTLGFVTIEHLYHQGDTLLISERQDIVYREASRAAAPPPPIIQPGEPAGAARLVDATPQLLFRYSALTFNSHRIHYDKQYAQQDEGYAGLVVHGPLQATLLFNHAARLLRSTRLDFSFRGVAPLIGEQVFGLCHTRGDDMLQCWTRGSDGTIAMKAEVKEISAS